LRHKKDIMTHTQVQSILQKAIQLAEAQKIEIAVSLVDTGGHLIGFIKTTQCSFAAIDVSKRKATTAAAFGMPTDTIGEIVQANPFMKEAFASFSDTFYFGGGLPILLDGKICGGIGVSGVNPVQDKVIAVEAIG
jgi:glc operon protein GlcG